MMKAAGRAGIPLELLQYIRSLYSGTMTKLKVGKSIGGLRQGDHLSTLLLTM